MSEPTKLDPHGLHELKLLEHVEATPRLNNRQAARILGVSIKLAHVLLTRMVEKGLVHVTKHHARRWDYFLTPQGMIQKTRLTVQFVEFSMDFYRHARRQSAACCRTLAERGQRRVSFLGAGELAEIVYLGVQEWGLTLTAVYADDRQGTFMQLPILPLSAVSQDRSDALVVCLYDATTPMRPEFLPAGVAPLPHMAWVFGAPLKSDPAASAS